MNQILDRLVALLIAMSNLTKLSSQKRVNDRSEKNDGRNEVERGRITTSRGVDAKREIPKIKFSLP
jgi:hypothetical protein